MDEHERLSQDATPPSGMTSPKSVMQPVNEVLCEAQAVRVSNINPTKLLKKLQLKFGSGFEIHVEATRCAARLTCWLILGQMMHNVYSIKAAGRLSPVSCLRRPAVFPF